MNYIRSVFLLWLFFPFTVQASFIESTIGTAVVNDASATYFNPAALTLLKNAQIITLGSIADARSSFSGQITQTKTHFVQAGSSAAKTHYFLPSFYFAKPMTDKVTFGLAVVANSFNRNIEENSILRYDQSNNSIQSVDIVPALGIKLNEFLSFGAAINLTYADFLLQPIVGFPSLNIPDSQSRNESDGTGLGGDIGFVLKPSKATTVGFNYRSAITYRLSGKSIFIGTPAVISNQYSFDFWTPARSVISINQFLTPALGMIATIQRIQWDKFRELSIHGIATQIGSQSLILDAKVPYYLHNTWLLTLGGNYRINPKWIVRVAGTYNQSPGNANYQLANGNSIILGGSTGYEIYKNIIIDGSYAHAFIQDENIHIASAKSVINGVNKGSRDSVSLKLTFNLD